MIRIVIQFLKFGALSLALFLVFLLLTFPFQRLGPQIRKGVEAGLQKGLGVNAHCALEGFDFTLPLGFSWKVFECRDAQDKTLLELQDAHLSLFPFFESLTGKVGKGTLSISGDFHLSKLPSSIRLEATAVPIQKFFPLIAAALARINPNMPREIKLEGNIQGVIDLPFEAMQRKSGKIDLKFEGLKLPEQSLLGLIGIKELAFTKSVLKADLNGGKLTIQDAQFLSPELSGKVEGAVDFPKGTLSEPSPAITLKWQVAKTDALMSAPLGQALLSAPCPSPDSQNFCTRRINRMQDIAGPF